MWLLIAFIAVPLIEIALFIQIGGFIGLWPTLAIVLATAIIGARLVRSQGARELRNLQNSFSALNDPSEPLAHGAMIIFAGALLLTPGFFTDAVGFALLVPPIRALVYQKLRANISVSGFSAQSTRRETSRPDVIDGDYVDLDRAQKPQDGPSKWTNAPDTTDH